MTDGINEIKAHFIRYEIQRTHYTAYVINCFNVQNKFFFRALGQTGKVTQPKKDIDAAADGIINAQCCFGSGLIITLQSRGPAAVAA